MSFVYYYYLQYLFAFVRAVDSDAVYSGFFYSDLILSCHSSVLPLPLLRAIWIEKWPSLYNKMNMNFNKKNFFRKVLLLVYWVCTSMSRTIHFIVVVVEFAVVMYICLCVCVRERVWLCLRSILCWAVFEIVWKVFDGVRVWTRCVFFSTSLFYSVIPIKIPCHGWYFLLLFLL